MAAARRSGEKKYSLKAQAEMHLGFWIDKSAQSSDWNLRPLDVRQLHYAALDAYATLLLYENQRGRNLNGASGLRRRIDSAQNLLPLDAESVGIEPKTSRVLSSVEKPNQQPELTDEAVAILGIITELPSRYNLDGLAASIGSERVGLAGWIVDRRLGVNAELDDETVKIAISGLCESGLGSVDIVS